MNSQPDNDRGRDNVIAAITTLARLQGDDVDKAISTQLTKNKGWKLYHTFGVNWGDG